MAARGETQETGHRPATGLAAATLILAAAVAVTLVTTHGDDRVARPGEPAQDPAAFFAANPPHRVVPSPRGLGISLDNPEFRDAAERERELESVVAIGADWVRFDVKWSHVQEGGTEAWDWVRYDELVTAARARGLHVVVNLAYTPPWARPEGASDKHGPDSDELREAFGRFVGAAVERYRDRVAHWEIWNEPNNTMFWEPQADPASYAALVRVAYPAVKEADPEATVIAGATAPAATADGRVDEVEFLQRVYEAGGREFFDAWSHHPYDFNLPPGTAHPDSGWWQMYGSEPSIRSVMEANGDGAKKLWATEHGVPSAGYGSLNEESQREWLRRAYLLWRDFPWAGGPIFNYMVRDGPSPGNADYWASLGLERSDATRKPAEDAVPDPWP